MYNTYVFHNFIGEEPDIIPSTFKDDVNRYLEQAVLYLQNQFDDFYASLDGRTGLQRYFSQFNVDFYDLSELKHHPKHEVTDIEKLDFYIKKISDICDLVMTDIENNLTKTDEHDAFILCCRVLAHEAYREGIGSSRESENEMMEKYKNKRSEISALWSENQFVKSISLDKDLDSNKCKRVADKLYTLLDYAKNQMNEKPLLQELSIKDLQYFITLFLNVSSLTAMYDYISSL